MRQFVRYGIIPVGIFFILLLVTVVLFPVLINVQKYVPEIEKQVSKATGRSFSLGPDLGVSFFPWLSISFSDMKIGNPPGFPSDDFIKVRTFEARIKVLPLLRKQIQISRFVVDGLAVNLEKNDFGQANWQFGEGAGKGTQSDLPPVWSLDLLWKRLSFALLAVTDGQVQWHDRTANVEYQVQDIMLLLNDFSQDRPVSLDCKATVNGKQVAVEGNVGPIVENTNQGALPVDIAFGVGGKLRGQMSGKITPQDNGPRFDLSLRLPPFSPRDFFSAWDLPFPLETKDSETFSTATLEFMVHGDMEKITIEKGLATLDDSKLNFSLLVQEVKSPHIDFTFELDHIDLDHYLPLSAGAVQVNDQDWHQEVPAMAEHLRWKDFSLDGVIQVGALKIHGGNLTEVHLPLNAKKGIFTTVTPATLNTSGGQVEAAFTLDLQATVPTIQATLSVRGLDAETLLHDFSGSDYLHGTLSSELALQFAGDTLQTMKKNLSGEVTIMVLDGAMVGVNLSKMVEIRESHLQRTASGDVFGEKLRTEFTEAKSVVTINHGLMQFRETSLFAPSCNLQASGTVDIVQQQLNLQMETGFVAIVVGKGGREEKVERSALFSISGTFSEPEVKNLKAPTSGGNAGGRNNVKQLVAQKLSSPGDDDVKNLIGKDLVDPAVVAQRFGLQSETLRRSEMKKKFSVGTGKIHIGVLQEEETHQ